MNKLKCKNCGGKLIKKYNIEYHELGKVIQLSRDEYICLNCHKLHKQEQGEIKSKCCGEEVYYLQSDFFEPWRADGRPYCQKCRKPAEIEGIEFECSICNKKIKDIPKNRVKVIIDKTSYTPETWGICSSCRQWKRKPSVA